MMAEGSVAPKERVNIVFKPSTGGAQEEVELPLKLMMLGDFTGVQDTRQLEDRKPISIDKDNFNDVMRSHKLGASFTVPDTLSGDKNADLAVNLKFETLKDFEPEQVAKQVPELDKLLDLRNALTALKGPLGNVPTFRRKLQEMVLDENAREKLLKELSIETEQKSD
ncbi:MAG: type VI secretion system contractile sheath small subunit [Gammaproteobacteria bacterium]|nr:type VI secretion system contractile sheath small subunit [Gammaproteobacteria bacterium]